MLSCCDSSKIRMIHICLSHDNVSYDKLVKQTLVDQDKSSQNIDSVNAELERYHYQLSWERG